MIYHWRYFIRTKTHSNQKYKRKQIIEERINDLLLDIWCKKISDTETKKGKK